MRGRVDWRFQESNGMLPKGLVLKLTIGFLSVPLLIGFSWVNAAGKRSASAEEVERVIGLSTDTAYGEFLATECVTCHSRDPNANGKLPLIYGLPPEAIVWAMLEYGSGIRTNATMKNVVESLGDEEISAIAHYLGTSFD